MGRKRKYQYYATYIGEYKKISISGVGEARPGKEFEVDKKVFNTLNLDPNFKTRKGYVYVKE
jgi:hypothetical protein